MDPAHEPTTFYSTLNGYGGYPYRWVRRGGFGFQWGDYRWYDRTGHCYMS